jgi:hypothetical protein
MARPAPPEERNDGVLHLSDDRSSRVREGDAVVLSWARDAAAVLTSS